MTDYFSRAMNFQDDNAVVPVQDSIARPAPIPRPGTERLKQRQQPPQGGTDYFSRAIRSAPDVSEADALATQPQAAAPAPAAAPQPQKGWLAGIVESVQGKQDPKYSGIPVIAEVLNKEGKLRPGSGLGSEQWGWLTGAEDKDMAKVYEGILGDRFVRTEQDANGYPVVVYKDQNGQEAKAYVNAPGLDMQDVVRGAVGATPFALAGGAVGGLMKGSALIPRMVGQGLGMGATSVVQDAAGVLTGTTTLDPRRSMDKAAAAAIGGAGGEAAGAAISGVIRRMIGEPRLYDKAAGRLTAEGEAIAKSVGIDVEGLPPDALRQLARSMMDKADPEVVMRQISKGDVNVRRTLGEMTGNKKQLLREQQMQGGAYGDDAAKNMDAFRAMQEADLRAVAGQEAARIAPDRVGTSIIKGDVGANINANTQAAYQNAKDFAEKAWKEVPRITASDEALAKLPESLDSRFKAMPGIVLTEGRTPRAAEMLKDIEAFMKGEAPTQVSRLAPASPVRDTNAMRETLFDSLKAAESGSRDAKAAGAIYDAFNDWIKTAAKMAGDPTAAAKLSTARGMTRQMHEIFTGKKGTPESEILKKVLEQGDTPELIINTLFSAPARSEIKNGAVPALKALKRGYYTYLPKDAAKSAWDDIRMAFWLRTVQQKTGETGGPAAMSSAIRTMLKNQGSIARELFEPSELARFRRIAAVLDDVKQRNPNSSWAGVSIGALLKDIADSVLTLIGGNSLPVKMGVRFAAGPVRNQYGAVQARKATGNLGGYESPARNPLSLGDVGASIGAGSERR